MNILFISITKNWVYRLYEEYLINIELFINKKFNNIFIERLFFEETDIDIIELNKIDINKYEKILFSGNLDYFYFLKNKIDDTKYYYINIEQMSHESYYKIVRSLDYTVNIIDYSEENIPFLINNFNKVFLIPPYFENKEFINKDIDILSIVNNEYRKNILDNFLKVDNINKLFIDNCYGNERDNLFLRSKIYINIHCSEKHKTMELLRITNLIMNKVIVISEKTIYPELFYLKDFIIILNNFDELNDVVNNILNNYNLYFFEIFKNFNYDNFNNYLYDKFNLFLSD